MRILVAEDNAASRTMLVRLLTRCGHDVLTASDGTEALARLELEDSPRLAILDVQMPGLDGTEVCRRVRASETGGRRRHLVLLTALGEKEDVIKGLESGADDYLTKPVDARELKARLAGWERAVGGEPAEVPAIVEGSDVPAVQAESAAPDDDDGDSHGATLLDAPRGSRSFRRRSASLEGALVAGKYEVLEVLGKGGMGVVYKARHTILDEVVALKVLHDHVADRPDVRERFLREAKAAMKFSHANAIPVRDFGLAEGGVPFMTLGYSSGQSLRRVIRDTGRFPVARAISLVRQCLLALREAHAHGIVHRDLKPENVLVETTPGGGDRPLICDFGMAKLQDKAALEGEESVTGHSVVGTPHYMAPEQAAGDTVDHRVDIYAMGCILYELVTGTKLFEAENAAQVLMKQVTQNPEAPSRRAPGIPPRLEKLILRSLDKDPDLRPQSAAEFLEALDDLSVPDSAPLRKLRVLLAEDNVVNQLLAARMLAKHGYEVSVANDGREALELLVAGGYDVVLMDGEMPHVDGFAATAEIRRRDRAAGRHTPVVGITGTSRESDRQACLAAGMDEHVAKPVEAAALFEAIGKVVKATRIRESRSEVMRREAKPFDESMALARVEGDKDLLRELVRLFLEESARLVEAIRSAVAAGDGRALQSAAHELRGVAANCSANVVAKVAEELEGVAARWDLGAARAAAARLEAAVESVQPTIQGCVDSLP